MKNFAAKLRHFRKAAGMSQSRLAARAGFDHSYVSRLEMDNRDPTADAVCTFAAALNLAPQERDELLISAGYMPVDRNNVLADIPVLQMAHRIAQDESIPADARLDMLAAIRMACRQAVRASTAGEAD